MARAIRPIDDTSAPPTRWPSYLEKCAAHFEKATAPRLLLHRAASAHHRGDTQFLIGIDGSAGGYMHSHPDSVHWERLESALPMHPRVQPTWLWMARIGMQPRWAAWAETNVHQIDVEVKIDAASLAEVIAQAKPAMGVGTAEDGAAFDMWLVRYLDETSFADYFERERWRQRYPAGQWPWLPGA